ncbi:MAG: hypothetical protein K2Z81_27170 [Cyanobacteria bacterium]|nr:hypothetical protein [Cyanobacteriota bacterium]
MANNMDIQIVAENNEDPNQESGSTNLLDLVEQSRVVDTEEEADSTFAQVAGMKPIEGINSPAGWQKEIEERGLDRNSRSVNFYPPDGSDTVLSVFDRGFPVAGSGGDEFQTLLSKDPHPLTASELDSMGEQVLGTLSDKSAFKISRAETRDLNGQKALVVEGEWLSSNKKFHGYFVPGEDNHIQELYFEGVDPSFSKHFSDAFDSINSVRWKEAQAGD